MNAHAPPHEPKNYSTSCPDAKPEPMWYAANAPPTESSVFQLKSDLFFSIMYSPMAAVRPFFSLIPFLSYTQPVKGLRHRPLCTQFSIVMKS